MNYDEAVLYIESLSPTLVRPGLERFAQFMNENGQLQDRSPNMHVAGTNGKGSVACMLAATLSRSGLKTGKYTGPHLLAFNERYQIDNELISDSEFAQLCSNLRKKSEEFGQTHPEHGPLTWFELLTAIAFFYFAKHQVEASVFEVGLGGLYDATNVLAEPTVTGIVTVSLDHTHILGSTIQQIAFEKAGILKQKIPLVTACTGEALAVVLAEAKAKEVPAIVVSDELVLSCGNDSEREKTYVDTLQNLFSRSTSKLRESLQKQKGYQRLNACVAATMLAIWDLENSSECLNFFDEALTNFFWPGRLQFFENKSLLLDGAHNIDGAKALKKSIDELFPKNPRCYILSFYKSKQFKEILSQLLKPGDLVFASKTTGRRAVVPAEEIVKVAQELGAKAQAFNSLNEAFEASAQITQESLLRIGCGSFATVSAGLKYLGYKNPAESRFDSNCL